MKSRSWTNLRMAVAVVCGVACLVAVCFGYLPANGVVQVSTALFGIAWLVQAYSLQRQL